MPSLRICALMALAFSASFAGTRFLHRDARTIPAQVRPDGAFVRVEIVLPPETVSVAFPRNASFPVRDISSSAGNLNDRGEGSFALLESDQDTILRYSIPNPTDGTTNTAVPWAALIPMLKPAPRSWRIDVRVATPGHTAIPHPAGDLAPTPAPEAVTCHVAEGTVRSGFLIAGAIESRDLGGFRVLSFANSHIQSSSYVSGLLRSFALPEAGPPNVFVSTDLSRSILVDTTQVGGLAVVGHEFVDSAATQADARAVFHERLSHAGAAIIPQDLSWLAHGTRQLMAEQFTARCAPPAADAMTARARRIEWYSACAPLPTDPQVLRERNDLLWLFRNRLSPLATEAFVARFRGHAATNEVLTRIYRALPELCSGVTSLTGMFGEQAESWTAEHVTRQVFEHALGIGVRSADRPEPLPDALLSPDTEDIQFLVTAGTDGFLEGCGCNINTSGNAAMRNGYIDQQRKTGNPVVLDLGLMFPIMDSTTSTTGLRRQEEENVVGRVFAAGRYDCLVPTAADLVLGKTVLAGPERRKGLPFASVNLRGTDVGPRFVSLCRGNEKILLIPWTSHALTRPGVDLGTERGLAAQGLWLSDAIESCRQLAADAGDEAIVVVAGHIPFRVQKKLCDIDGIDVVLTSNRRVVTEKDGKLISLDLSRPHRRNGVWVVPIRSEAYGLSDVSIRVAGGEVSFATCEYRQLRDRESEHAPTRKIIDSYYEQAVDPAEWSKHALFPERLSSKNHYVGSMKCVSCHMDAAKAWANSKHAKAYNTLLRARRHFQPKCVSCHVVGMSEPSGFSRNDNVDSPLAHVGCEACHGHGSDHVRNPRKGNIDRSGLGTCAKCHDEKHSPEFRRASQTYLERIRHWK